MEKLKNIEDEIHGQLGIAPPQINKATAGTVSKTPGHKFHQQETH